MINLTCCGDLAKLGIKLEDGLNITAFLDHLEACQHCRQAEAMLMVELNRALGREELRCSE